MKSIPEKIYNTFNTNERVQLTIAALARSDSAELKRLGNSCPLFTYKMLETEFVSKMDNIQKLCMYLTIVFHVVLHKIERAEAVIAATHYAELCTEIGFHIGITATSGVIVDDKVFLKLDEEQAQKLKIKNEVIVKRDEAFSELNAILQAFNEACTEENLNVKDLLKWSGIDKQIPNSPEYLSFQGVIDEESFNHFKKNFSSILQYGGI
jgi:hypothetical protein